MIGKLLILDGDDASGRAFQTALAPHGLDISVAGDGPAALERVTTDRPDVIFASTHLPGLNGLEVLERIKSIDPTVPVVMLTAAGDNRAAVRAMQSGAAHYLTKPIDHDEAIAVVHRALESRALRREVVELRRRVGQDVSDSLASQMGSSVHIRKVIEQVRAVASSTATVLIVGEAGTGKELVAQAIHRQSDRRLKPFVALDCGAIPEALLESELFGQERTFAGPERPKNGGTAPADGGTVFLDEIGNLPISLQGKLLRVLESKHALPASFEAPKLDVRFLAATSIDLQARVAQGLFRADLYFRIAEHTMALPPLRERPDDVAFLAQRFMEAAGIELRRPVHCIDRAAVALLKNHPWPGNVRELRNVIRQAVVQTRDLVIQPADLESVLSGGLHASPITFPQSNGMSLRQAADQAARSAEREIIVHALQATRGNKSQAAKALKTDYKTLHVKMKALRIRAHDFKSA
jgi:two-component system nitrogen regulation response regulator GlnG